MNQVIHPQEEVVLDRCVMDHFGVLLEIVGSAGQGFHVLAVFIEALPD
ncbi:hypothetical protein [Thioalkalivibrio sp. ALE19]|nr:hypothetical protein [Thioalkalivibrio sp. ALE19]